MGEKENTERREGRELCGIGKLGLGGAVRIHSCSKSKRAKTKTDREIGQNQNSRIAKFHF